MKNIIFLCSALFFTTFGNCQQKDPPILFAEYYVGGGGEFSGYGGPLIGAALNYQQKNNFYTFRVTALYQYQYNYVYLSPFTPLPVMKKKHELNEYALMYGRRWIKKGSSFSVSTGISVNNFKTKYSNNNQTTVSTDVYMGVPFEVNVKWFKARKKPYHIYSIVPVGKPTAFGHNFGFKLVGNVSKHSYMGIGLVYGWGWHKKY